MSGTKTIKAWLNAEVTDSESPTFTTLHAIPLEDFSPASAYETFARMQNRIEGHTVTNVGSVNIADYDKGLSD